MDDLVERAEEIIDDARLEGEHDAEKSAETIVVTGADVAAAVATAEAGAAMHAAEIVETIEQRVERELAECRAELAASKEAMLSLSNLSETMESLRTKLTELEARLIQPPPSPEEPMPVAIVEPATELEAESPLSESEDDLKEAATPQRKRRVLI